MRKPKRTARLRDDTTRIVADIHECSISKVKKVRSGDREDDSILETCIEYQQGKSALIQHLKELVQLNKSTSRYARETN